MNHLRRLSFVDSKKRAKKKSEVNNNNSNDKTQLTIKESNEISLFHGANPKRTSYKPDRLSNKSLENKRNSTQKTDKRQKRSSVWMTVEEDKQNPQLIEELKIELVYRSQRPKTSVLKDNNKRRNRRSLFGKKVTLTRKSTNVMADIWKEKKSQRSIESVTLRRQLTRPNSNTGEDKKSNRRKRTTSKDSSKTNNRAISTLKQTAVYLDVDLFSETSSAQNQGPFRKNYASTTGSVFSEEIEEDTVNSQDLDNDSIHETGQGQGTSVTDVTQIRTQEATSVIYLSNRNERRKLLSVHRNRLVRGGNILFKMMFNMK